VGLLGLASALPLEGSAPPLVPEVALELSVPAAPEPPVPAAASPVAPLVASLSVPPEACSPVVASASLAGVVELAPVVEDLVVVEVVAVVLVRVASLSAEVLLGGVISGVLRGVASETLLPPQAVRVKPQTRISAHAPSAARRALTLPAGPSAGRRSGSR
jgi:hypothetical protein